MSSVVARETPPVAATSAPRTSVSSPANTAQDTKKCKVDLVGADKLQSPLAAVDNTCECVQRPKFDQVAAPSQAGLGTSMLPSIVSAVFVVIGWFVVNKAQGNRERRKQIREFIGKLCDDLDELESLAIGYHTAPREEAKEHEIISKLGRFERNCTNLPRFVQSQWFSKAVHHTKLKVDGQRIQVLRKAMTLNHFGAEAHSSALGRHDNQISELQLAAVDMRETLEGIRIEALD